MSPIEVTISIGPEHSDTSITVVVTCEGDAYPDFLDDACRRAGDEALRLHRALASDAST